jgi:hypothetical protein
MVAACPSTAQGQHSGYRQCQGVLARSVCRGSPGNPTQRDGQVLLRYLVVQAPPRGSAGSRPSTVPPGSGGCWPGRPRLAAPARTRRCRGRGSVRVGTCTGRPTVVRRGCGPRGRAAPRARRRVGLCCGRGLDGRAACVAGHVRRMLRSLDEAGSASGHSSLASCCPRTRASASSPCSRPSSAGSSVCSVRPRSAAMLLAAQGRLVPAEELLEWVWDQMADPFTTAAKVTVSRPHPTGDRDRLAGWPGRGP